MSSLVLELEQEAYDTKASLSNILRKAKAIAVKLQLKQPLEWVESELNGYGPADVPDYRVLHGSVKAHNPYNGLIPVMCGDPEFERIISEHHVREPVSAIEHMLETTGDPRVAFSSAKAQALARMCNAPTFPIYLILARSSLASILDAVRNKVLDWSLKLQIDGILGEGMSFRPEEKATVSGKGDTYNVGSIGSFAGNLGGQVAGDVTGNATQNVEQELGKVAALVDQLKLYHTQVGLNAHQEAELGKQVNALDEEVRLAKPKAKVVDCLLKSLKATMEGASGNLIASGVISAISNIRL